MAKLQFLLRAPGGDIEAFGARIRGVVVPSLLAREPEALKVTFTEVGPPRLALIPFSREPVALLSIWMPDEPEAPRDDDVAGWVDAIGATPGERLAGYLVEESTPLAYERDWGDGATTPGVGLLTVFRRRRGLSDASFIERWHGGHTPMSLEIHPLFAYVRNVVRVPVVDGSPHLDAIVEEHFERPADLIDPTRFFGGWARMVPNMVRVAVDIAGFIDLGSMRTWLVSELHARSPAGERPGGRAASDPSRGEPEAVPGGAGRG